MYLCTLIETIMKPKLPTVYVCSPAREFILPYIDRELCGRYERVDNPADAQFHVAVINPGDDLPEGFPAGGTVLECPNIVGTGMTGLPMELACRIARGTYFHILGNDTRLSTIHASDVARAVGLAIGSGRRLTLTDGADPSFHDFADALAYRINDKRILTVKPLWARFLMNGALRRTVTTDAVVYHISTLEGFIPTPVTEYLRTHVYDDESL